jgi:hypothetical protein
VAQNVLSWVRVIFKIIWRRIFGAIWHTHPSIGELAALTKLDPKLALDWFVFSG